MGLRLRRLLVLVLLLMSFQLCIRRDAANPQVSASIYGTVTDANTGLPIPNATVIVWDMKKLVQPTLGAGIYFTDENGEYNISGTYLTLGNTYRVYVYKGDFAANLIEYVPAFKEFLLEIQGETEASFSLVPGALIELVGTPYLVTASSPEALGTTIRVLTNQTFDASFIDEYGSSTAGNHDWFLGLSREIVIIPANTLVTLEAEIWFYEKGLGRFLIDSDVFRIYNSSLPFLLPQGYTESIQFASYSLRRGLDIVQSRFVSISEQLDKAQSIGFVVFDERRSLAQANQEMNEASATLTIAQIDDDYLKAWGLLREALTTMDLIYNPSPDLLDSSLERKRIVASTSAVYLSAIMACFSAVLAFFFFEEKRKKVISSLAIYTVFLLVLYVSYPGAHIIIEENVTLFLESAAISFIGVSAIVFGLPLIWKERRVEGEVSWRSAISIIFSMGKRQIRRKRIRGFFTILSIIILVLAFTSLTSFGTLFGIVSEELTATAPSDGVLVKRMLNESFSPLGSSDPTAVSKVIDIKNVALRLENLPNTNPVVRLVGETGSSWFIYGVLGVTPTNESLYTHLDEKVVEGSYLSENLYGEILISRSVANSLGVTVGENVTLEVLGTGVSSDFTVVGVIPDEEYTSLADVDGSPFGPLRLEDGSARRCNSTEVVIMSLNSAERLQKMIEKQYPEGASQLVVLSDILFQPIDEAEIDSIVRTLIFVFSYDVFVSSDRYVTRYYIGSIVELKGAAELLIPLVMVGLNVSMVMMNAVYERRKEIRTLSMVGLNPTHIGLIFVAEAIILGMVGGSLGYLSGLGFYRVMVLFGQDLMVREKLEWWWSAIGFGIALAASVLSSIRPAALAVSTYTPSKVKRVKRTEEETEVRKEEIFRVYQERQSSMPVKVLLNEKEFFISYISDRLNELKSGYLERVENIEDVPEKENVKGELVKEIKFEYYFEASGQDRRTKNRLILIKSPQEDYYRVRMFSEPAVLGIPESAVDRSIDFVHEAVLYWARNKEKILGI